MTETGKKEIHSDIDKQYNKDAYVYWRNHKIDGSWWLYGISSSGDFKTLHLSVHLFCELLCHVILYMCNKLMDFNHSFIANLYFNLVTSS